ncbi:MAG: hypothetical protein WBQ49_07710, partial [Rhodomicrobium sp.]
MSKHCASTVLTADDERWGIAVKREKILREALKKNRLSAAEVLSSCKVLGVKPAYFYRLLNVYRKDRR